MDIIYDGVGRPRFFATLEEFAEHTKAVGNAIADDAEQIRLDPYNIYSIKISAEIKPDTEFTVVRYEIERRADPRVEVEKNVKL